MNPSVLGRKFCFILLSCFIVNLLNLNTTATTMVTYTKNCPASSNVNIIKCESLNKVAAVSTSSEVYGRFVYRCACNYQESTRSSSNESSLAQINNCIQVHPGMAIKGSNLIYHHWVNKEHCMNLCLKTSRSNGDAFDCHSFEHWHSECTYESLFARKTTTLKSRTSTTTMPTTENEQSATTVSTSRQMKACTEYLNLIKDVQKTVTHLHEKSKRRVKKVDLCVLSNQTIQSAASDFTFNHGVTYYEVQCNRQVMPKKDELIWTPNRVEKPVKKTTTTKRTVTTTTTTTRTSTTDSVTKDDYKECDFNPCSQQGICVYDVKRRFTCLCTKGFYGIYCQLKAIDRQCNENSMDISIAKEYLMSLNLKMSQIYINEKKNVNSNRNDLNEENEEELCKLKHFNQTHLKFHVPFDKCETKRITSSQQQLLTYSNDVFISMNTHEEFISTVSCTSEELKTIYNKVAETESDEDEKIFEAYELDSKTTTTTTTTKKQITTIVAEMNRSCVINNIDIQIRFYADRNYDIILNTGDTINFSDRVYVEVTVLYSEKSFKLFKLLDLRNAHLIINNFWLDANSEKKENEYFIENGCANENINFYDPTAKQKKAIRFSIKSEALKVYSKFSKLPIMFHSELDICVDNKSDDQLNVKQHSFTKLKYCENMNEMCSALKNTATKEQQRVKTSATCQLKISNGPFFARNLDNKHKAASVGIKSTKKSAISKGLKQSINNNFQIMASIFTFFVFYLKFT